MTPDPIASGGSGPEGDQLLRYAEELRDLQALEGAGRRRVGELEQRLGDTYAQQLVIVQDLKQAYELERRQRQELQEAYLSALRVLAAAVEARDGYAVGHIERVRSYSLMIAGVLGLDATTHQHVEVGAILHDIGKIGVPDAVLGKASRLEPEDWLLLQQHPMIGCNLLRLVPFLAPATEVVLTHHEHWDGEGYPQRLRGEAIPLAGRIVAVADAFDAMTTDRAYRAGRSTSDAISELRRSAGSQFDPAVTEAFIAGWGSRGVD